MNGKANHLGPEQREGGHAVAGLPEVLDQGEFSVRIGSDQAAVHFQVLRGGIEVFAGQRLIGFAQQHECLHCAGRIGVADQRTAHNIDLFGQPVRLPACHAVFIT